MQLCSIPSDSFITPLNNFPFNRSVSHVRVEAFNQVSENFCHGFEFLKILFRWSNKATLQRIMGPRRCNLEQDYLLIISLILSKVDVAMVLIMYSCREALSIPVSCRIFVKNYHNSGVGTILGNNSKLARFFTLIIFLPQFQHTHLFLGIHSIRQAN